MDQVCLYRPKTMKHQFEGTHDGGRRMRAASRPKNPMYQP